MRVQVFILILLFLLLSIAGCGGKQDIPRLGEDDNDSRKAAHVIDPEGPIPPPQLPPELAAASRASVQSGSAIRKDGLQYTVVCTVADARQGAAPSSKKPAGNNDSPDDNADSTAVLVSTFEKTSSLHRLQDSPPGTLIGLEQRLAVALQEAREILRSYGYYAGRVRGRVQRGADGPDGQVRAEVRVTFFPGPQYGMGKTTVIAALPPAMESKFPRNWARLPKTLADVELPAGAPATAAEVLAAVDKVRERFLDNGFPFAVIASTRYVADHTTQTLEAEVRVNAGSLVLMGDIERHGAPSVRDSYFQALRKWRKGRPWRQSRVEALRDTLRESGLFQSIELAPAERDDADGNRPVLVTVQSAPERTVGGAVKYHSDFGPGLQGNWEHRNLTGRGDSLRIALPLWLDMQEVTANYRLPYFLRPDQDFVAGGGFLNQDTDAYRLTSGAASAGVERRLNRNWAVSLQGSVEGGSIKEPDLASRDYMLYGIPFSLMYDTTRSLLDAVRGQRLNISLTPYTGEYDGDFNLLRSRVEGQAFFALAGKDTLVLALRGVVGAALGADSEDIPPSVRFYSGGGGSVRGYEFQSLGPRNSDNKPLGGGSLVEVSTETRWKLTPEWGLVAFVDGGTVYENVFDDVGQTMRWGAGVGVRYYTVIGPVRFDVATPLTPRDDDDPLQFYISIGQSF